MGHEIIGRDAVRRRVQRAGGVALGAHDPTGLLRRGFQLGTIGRRVVTRVGPVVPVDLELLPALLSRPGVAGDDGDAAERIETRRDRRSRHFDDLFDAGHRQRRLRIEAPGPAAIDRTTLDRGVFHARHDHIDAVDRAAAHDVVEIDDRQRFADIAPRARRLKRSCMWSAEGIGRARPPDEIAEAELPPGRLVNDGVVLRMAGRRIGPSRSRAAAASSICRAMAPASRKG